MCRSRMLPAPPASGRKDSSQCDSGAGTSPFIIAGGIAMADGPEPFVADAVAVLFLCAAGIAYMSSTQTIPVCGTKTPGNVIDIRTRKPIDEAGKREPKTWKIPPPPGPPNRQKRCADAAIRCANALSHPDRLMKCEMSRVTCETSNLPTIFPHGEVVY